MGHSLLGIGIGICFSGQRPSTGTSKVIQCRRREKRSKTEQEKKHPTKLVKAATCCRLSPLTTTTGWILRGPQLIEWSMELLLTVVLKLMKVNGNHCWPTLQAVFTSTFYDCFNITI